MLPSLGDLFGVFMPIGGLIGGVFGFATRAPTTRDLIRNVVDGGAVGAMGGAAIALAIWLGGTAAGG